MKKIFTAIAVICAMLAAMPCVMNAYAAGEDEYELRLESEDGSLYKYSFGKTEYYFLSNTKSGEETSEPVCIYLPDSNYGLGYSTDNWEQTEDSSIKYTISDYGSYNIKISAPEQSDGSCPIVYFDFKISEYPNGEKIFDFGNDMKVYTNVISEKVAPGAYFRFDYNVNAVYNYKKESYNYTSGQQLTGEGEYTIHFTSSQNEGFWYDYSFVISTELPESSEQEPSADTVASTSPQTDDEVNVINEESVSLQESYDVNREMYKQTLSDERFLFTNVENGGKAKMIMLSYGSEISVLAYKENQQIQYQSGTELTEEGEYTFYISSVLKTEGDEARRLVSVYLATVTEQDEAELNGEQPQIKEPQKNLLQIMDEINAAISEEPVSEGMDSLDEIVKKTENNNAIASIVDKLTEESNLSTEEINNLVAKLVEARVSGQNEESSQEYNLDSKLYINRFSVSDYITTNVPNGAVVNDDVTVNIVGESVKAKAYKDDESIDITENMTLTEHGDYRFDLEYFDGTKKTVTFYIVKHAVNNLRIINAPSGFVITDVTKDQRRTKSWMTYYKMASDAKYEFSFQNTQNSQLLYSVSIQLDTKNPDFSIEGMKDNNSAPKPAEVVDLSGDIVRYEIYKDGKPYEFSGGELKESGWYNITAYDSAENQTVKNVKIYYQMKAGSIVAITAAVLIAAGCAGWVVYTRKNVSVS